MKVAANCLGDYTKMLVSVPVVPIPITTSPIVATTEPPAAKAKDVIVPLCHGGHTTKFSAKVLVVAADELK